MSRIKSLTLLCLAMLLAAPLAFAQGGTAATPATGTTEPAKTEAAAPAKAKSGKMASKKAAMEKIDLNSASREELIKLPGVGEAIADKIIAARPLKSKTELVSKGVVTKAQLSKFSSRVIAKQAPVASK